MTNANGQSQGNGSNRSNGNGGNRRKWVPQSPEQRMTALRDRLAKLLLAPKETDAYNTELASVRGAIEREETAANQLALLRALPYAEAVEARRGIEVAIARVKADLVERRKACGEVVAEAHHVGRTHRAFDKALAACVNADSAFRAATDDATRDEAGKALAETRAALGDAKAAWDALKDGEQAAYAAADRAKADLQLAERRTRRELDRHYEQLWATPKPAAQKPQANGPRRDQQNGPRHTPRQERLFKDGTRGAAPVGQGIRGGKNRAARQAVERATAGTPVPTDASHVTEQGKLVTTPFAALAAKATTPTEAPAAQA